MGFAGKNRMGSAKQSQLREVDRAQAWPVPLALVIFSLGRNMCVKLVKGSVDLSYSTTAERFVGGAGGFDEDGALPGY